MIASSVTQISVFMKNVPGTLQRLLRAIRKAGIDIEGGIMVNDATDHAVVRMVVDQPQKTIHLLGDAGLVVLDDNVDFHGMPDRPGELLALADKLAKGRIDIAYIYGSAPRAYLHTSDDAKVIRLLGAGRRGKGRSAKR